VADDPEERIAALERRLATLESALLQQTWRDGVVEGLKERLDRHTHLILAQELVIGRLIQRLEALERGPVCH
jgi:hypothetical protein